MAIPTAQSIKGYVLLELIGEGAYGTVYRAHQPVVDREVAVKIIRPEYASQPDFIRRFESEAQLVARLEHLHIVPLYDYWRDPEGAYLVMRLMQGGSLEEIIQEGALPLAQVARILEQVGSALAAAHRRGIVHRDIKPANILLDEEVNAYLSDFGIAKALGEEIGMTLTGAIVGTPAFITPEQAQSLAVSPQTDIYALGVLLYVMLTGEHPFPKASPGDLIARHLRDPLPHLEEIDPKLPADLNGVIQRATAKDPAERYLNVAEMVADFREALGPELAPAPAGALIEELLEVSNPFKGLRAFQEADAEDFFGRGALTNRLLERLSETGKYNRFLAVVGPSGSGKSSVVNAGLLPALRSGSLGGSEDWYITQMVPGTHPLEELELALLRIAVHQPPSLLTQLKEDGRGLLRAARRILPDGAELLLVVDQFEEIFTQSVDKTEARHLMNLIYQAVNEPDTLIRFVITLRADFYDRPLMEPDFSALVQERTEVVVPLTSEELEEAIRCPVEGVGAEMEEGLALTIVGDVIDQPGALPLLQYALTELFERREGRTLTHEAYRSIGGVPGALGHRAENVFSGLDAGGQALSRQVFLRLVSLGEGVEDTRRRVLRSELATIDVPAVTSNPDESTISIDQMIESFGVARLLSFDHDPQSRAPTVEVTHEALLREWNRLKEWLEESRVDIRMQRLLGTAAQDWLETDQDPSFLLRGSRLAQFEGWAEETTLALTEYEKLFLQSSLEDEAQRQAQRAALERRSRNFLRALVAVLAVAAVVAVGLSLYAFNQQGIARSEADQRATAEVLALEERQEALNQADARATAQAEADASAEEALTQKSIAEAEAQAALEAYSLSLTAHIQNALDVNDTTLALALAIEANRMEDPPAEVQRVLRQAAYAPGPVQRLEVADIFPGVTSRAYSIALSPVDQRSLIGFEDGTLILWDIEKGEEISRLEGHTDAVNEVVFSPDGQTALSASHDHSVIHWDLEDGTEIQRFEGHSGWVRSVAFSPDGLTAVSGGYVGDGENAVLEPGELILWDVSTGEEIKRFEGHPTGLQAGVFTLDGSRIMASSGLFIDTFPEYSMYLWDVQSGEIVTTFDIGDGDNYNLVMHPDGKHAISGNNLEQVNLWDLESGEKVQTYEGLINIVRPVAISPDGKRIIAGDTGGRVVIWEVDTGAILLQASLYDYSVPWSIGPTMDLAVDYTGNTAVTVDPDNIIYLWDLKGALEERRFWGHQEWVGAMTFTPDDKQLVTGAATMTGVPGEDTSIRLWDVASGVQLRIYEGHENGITDLAVSQDGRWILSGSADGSMRMWNLETGEQVQNILVHTSGVFDVSISPDGKMAISGSLAAGNQDDGAAVWDLVSGELIYDLRGGEENSTQSWFSPDGLTAYIHSVHSLIDLQTGEILNEPDIICDFDSVLHPDGRSVICFVPPTYWVYRWDLETGQIIQGYGPHPGSRGQLELSSDGKLLLTSVFGGTLHLFDVESGDELLRFNSNCLNLNIAMSADGQKAVTCGPKNDAILWDLSLPLEVDEVLEWISANRYVRELTCEERVRYGITPLCGEEGAGQ